MRSAIGRALQVSGLSLAPAAVLVGLATDDLLAEVLLFGAALGAFLVGSAWVREPRIPRSE